MKIPKYWAMSVQGAREPGGKWLRLACWGWSDESTYDAQRKADARTAELALKVEAGAGLSRYLYGERPMREEILEGIANHRGSEVAVVTRNQYGARVLNAVNAMFIDIDLPDEGAMATQLKRLLGQRQDDPANAYVQRIATWASRHPDVGMRVYRTRAGLRCLVTNQVFDPGGQEGIAIMQALGSDPLYVTLCRAQGCFRARLTPKPWRCGIETPPGRYPWADYAVEMRYRSWEQRYEHRSASYAVCKFISHIGPHETHPDVAPVLALHDEMTCSAAERQLA